jgi:hypothetical protein
MVLPPTGLTTLLGAAGTSPDALVTTLIEHGCLTAKARRSRERLTALIAGVIQSEAQRPPMPGPSTIDMIARALRDADVLSEKGRRLDGDPPRAPWWVRWRAAIDRLANVGRR